MIRLLNMPFSFMTRWDKIANGLPDLVWVEVFVLFYFLILMLAYVDGPYAEIGTVPVCELLDKRRRARAADNPGYSH